jgi:hypothetical protein
MVFFCVLTHTLSLRLVMPPILFGALCYPFTRLTYMVFPLPLANGGIAGAFIFCKPSTHAYCLS